MQCGLLLWYEATPSYSAMMTGCADPAGGSDSRAPLIMGAEQVRNVTHPIPEIAAVLALPLAIMWITPLAISDRGVRILVDSGLSALTLAIAGALNLYHGDRLEDIGLRLDNFCAAAGGLLAFTLTAGAAILVVGLGFGSVHFGLRFAVQLAIGPLWGLEQQYGVQGIINRRYQTVFGPGKLSAAMTGLTFASLHLPNPTLMSATFVAGFFWSASFQKRPNLPAIALSHAVLSALLANSFPTTLLPNMKVGWGFWGIH